MEFDLVLVYKFEFCVGTNFELYVSKKRDTDSSAFWTQPWEDKWSVHDDSGLESAFECCPDNDLDLEAESRRHEEYQYKDCHKSGKGNHV